MLFSLVTKVLYFIFALIHIAKCMSYENYKIISFGNLTEEQMELIQNLRIKDNDHHQLEFFDPPTKNGEPIQMLVSPNEHNIWRHLEKAGIRYAIDHHNFQSILDEEKPPFDREKRDVSVNSKTKFLSRFNDYNKIQSFLEDLATENPGFVKLSSIGLTHEKRPINMITLVSGYKTDKTITALIDAMNFYIVPVLNSDGYQYSHTNNRMWRKNRSPCQRPGRNCCMGTDLNRNFDWFWGKSGSSNRPCSNIYAGKGAFSEPESRAARDFILQNKDSIKAYFSLHSKGQIWMFPYGYKKRTYADDVDDLREVAIRATKAVYAVNGEYYNVGSAADTTYAAAGGSDDWSKGVAKIKFVYLLELRPKGRSMAGFSIRPENIIPTGEETFAGMKVVFEEVQKRYVNANDNANIKGETSNRSVACRDSSRICAFIAVTAKCETKKNMKTRCKQSCGYC